MCVVYVALHLVANYDIVFYYGFCREWDFRVLKNFFTFSYWLVFDGFEFCSTKVRSGREVRVLIAGS